MSAGAGETRPRGAGGAAAERLDARGEAPPAGSFADPARAPDVEAAVAQAIATAANAPSSHNSQPWAVARVRTVSARRWISEHAALDAPPDTPLLVLALDEKRSLRALPAHRCEMLLSCGMYLEALVADLAVRGFDARVGVLRAAPGPASWPDDWLPLAAVAVTPSPRQRGTTGGAAAPERTTNRGPYRDVPIPESVRAELLALETHVAPPESYQGRLRIELIEGAARIRAASGFLRRHAGIDYSHPAAWEETYRFIHFDAKRIREAEDGMPITQLFGPTPLYRGTFYKYFLAPPTMSLLTRLGVHDRFSKGLGDLVDTSPLLVAFSCVTDPPSVEEQLVGGGAILSFWRKATARGLAIHPISVVLQHPDIRSRFQEELGLSGSVLFFCRAGYPSMSFPPAPKRRNFLKTIREI